jgi:transposase
MGQRHGGESGSGDLIRAPLWRPAHACRCFGGGWLRRFRHLDPLPSGWASWPGLLAGGLAPRKEIRVPNKRLRQDPPLGLRRVPVALGGLPRLNSVAGRCLDAHSGAQAGSDFCAVLKEGTVARANQSLGRVRGILVPKRSELAIRFGVILRKVWGGSRTWPGARAQSVVMSVWRTCGQQGRWALDFLSRFLRGTAVALGSLRDRRALTRATRKTLSPSPRH